MQPNNTSREVLLALRERVLAAEEPDRELDAELDVALFGGETTWKQANGTMTQYPVTRRASRMHVGGFSFSPVPPFTGLIDESLNFCARTLPKWSLRIGLSEGYRHPGAVMGRSYPTNKQAAAEHQSAPLAIIQCALDALIIEAEEAALAGGQSHG